MSDVIAPWLVRAKISPPRAPASVCRRANLLETLQAESDKPVVVLEAPAGFGKTQLLAQWREQLQSREELVAWYSFDSSDEAAQIPPYLAFACHRAGLDMSESGLMSGAYLDVRSAQALPIFMQQIERSERACTLILDDMERCTRELLERVIEPLLRLRAENLRVCMAWRNNPGIPLASYDLAGELCRIEATDLRFSKDEVSQVLGSAFSVQQSSASFELTEGWPAALQMLRVSLDRGLTVQPETSLAHEDARSGEYLQQQLLASMPDAHRDFLQQCAALDPVTAELADYAGERQDSARMLAELDYLHGLFAALDEDRDSYRLHPILRDFLVTQFEREAGAQYRRLMQRAASWYAQRGEILKAMRCAVDCDQPSLAAAIFERAGGLQLWVHEGMWRVIRALELLQDFALDEHPRTLLAQVLVKGKAGDLVTAKALMARAAKTSNNFQRDRAGGDDAALALEHYLMRTTLAQYGCSPSSALLSTPDAAQLQSTEQSEPVLRGYIRVFQCVTDSQFGQFERALEHARAAIEDFRAGASEYGELFMYLHMGQIDLVRGDSNAALAQYQRAGAMADRHFPGDKALQAIVDVLLGELFRELGDSARAAEHYERLVNASLSEAWFDIYMAAYEGMAGHLCETRGFDSALAYLGAAISHAREQQLPRLNRFLRALEARMRFRFQGECNLPAELTEQLQTDYEELRREPEITWREHEQTALAFASACFQDGRLAQAQTVTKGLLEQARRIGNERTRLRALGMLVLGQWAGGEKDSALQGLSELLSQEHASRFHRGLLDPGVVFFSCGILDDEQRLAALSTEQRDRVQALKASFNADSSALGPRLSERERQILACLAQGQPDKLIARALGISAHGVRYHLKKLYQKLDVHNRTEALVHAQGLGLLDLSGD